MNRLIVFDFDKTLIYEDSLTVVFKQRIQQKSLFFVGFYFLLKALSKLGLISVRYEKELSIRMIYGSNLELFFADCETAMDRLTWTPILKMLRKHIEERDVVVVISATAEYLLWHIFKDLPVRCIGTLFVKSKCGKLGIRQHPYGRNKRIILESNGVKEIDEMYYDSKSDEFLIPLCRNWNKVYKGQVINHFEK